MFAIALVLYMSGILIFNKKDLTLELNDQRYGLFRIFKRPQTKDIWKSTPFVRQVWQHTCTNEWGAVLCQKKYRTDEFFAYPIDKINTS